MRDVAQPGAAGSRDRSTSGSSAARRCILQLLIWFNLALVFPHLGIPGLFDGPHRRRHHAGRSRRSSASALNQGAYTARRSCAAGILSVDHGQTEASKSIGMTRLTVAAPHHPAAGDARHRPAARQRVHRTGQADLARQRHRLSAISCATRRRSTTPTPGHRAPDRRRLLVPRRRLGAPVGQSSWSGTSRGPRRAARETVARRAARR